MLALKHESTVLEERENSPISLASPVLGSHITYRQLFSDVDIATANQQPVYADPQMVINYMCLLSEAPSLTDMHEISALKQSLVHVAKHKGSIVHAGLCAEDIDMDVNQYARNFHGLMTELRGEMKEPVVMIGRFAGQFSKPRSSAYEEHDGILYPSFRGTNINGIGFDDRSPSIERMARGNQFASNALTALYRVQHQENDIEKIFSSHEGLHLANEIGYLRRDIAGHLYAGSAPMIWIGDRTNNPDGLHVRFAGMVENAIGLKIGPSMTQDKLGKVVQGINPKNDPGKVLPIFRFGADKAQKHLPDLLDTLMENGITMGICDPMHGNGKTDPRTGKKTRHVREIDRELMQVQHICAEKGFHLAGVSLEASGEDVTECLGPGVEKLDENYQSLCDPCLNPGQAVVQLRLFNGRKLAMG